MNNEEKKILDKLDLLSKENLIHTTNTLKKGADVLRQARIDFVGGMRLADAIFQRIAQHTDTCYFLPGGGAMFLVDALGKSGLNAVSCIHEQGAGFAALGHGMISGLGVCLVTSGPGVTNALTACLAAWTDSVPVLFISGQARTDSLRGNTRAKGLQYVDTVAMAKPITKIAYEPRTSAIDALMALDEMIEACTTGRKAPCWLSVPQDLQAATI